MKISTRISIVFSLISSSILILFGVLIYFLESSHQLRDFQERLKERVIITENFFLEKESFSPSKYEKIRTQFLHILPKETEEVIEILEGTTPAFKHHYSQEIKNELLNNSSFSFREKEIQGESKIFKVKGKNHLIIVTAVDEIGIQNLSFLMSQIILLITIGIPLILIISFIVTKKSLLPLSKKIQHANSISASNLDQRLRVINPNDEIGKLAIAFNKLLDRLETAFNSQKSFISNASHEIRNPLTAIMGEAEVAASKTRTSEEYQESLHAILAEAETLNSTVNNLLQLSKVTANEQGVQYIKFKFDDFLTEVKDSFNYLNPDNQLLFNLEKGTFYIVGNKNLLKTAIINLFDNACKYSSNKEVQVKLIRDKDFLSLTIYDKGIGIPKEELQKIKAPFYRGNNVIDIKGSGIGLALSDKIINLHKGTLEIQSQEGVGTEITIKIPLL